MNSESTGYDREDLERACKVMREGGVILYPTDTIWGLGCDASNEDAVRRIFRIKQRSDSKSMIVLLDSAAKLNYYVEDIPDVAYDLMELSEKPLTIIYDGARRLAPQLVAEDGSVGIRVTKELFSRDLCARMKGAVVSTSANVSGQPSPACFGEVSKEIIDAVDYVVEYRRNDISKSKPSSIIKLGAGGQVRIIRE